MSRRKTNLWDVLVTTVKAEGRTQTGKINISVTALCVLLVLGLAATNSIGDMVTNAIVVYKDGEPTESPGSVLVTKLAVGTFILLIVCLGIIYKMQNMKTAKSKAKNKKK